MCKYELYFLYQGIHEWAATGCTPDRQTDIDRNYIYIFIRHEVSTIKYTKT